MTSLFLLREERVPVEELRGGDKIILPSGTRVVFHGLSEYDDCVIVRWWRRAEHGDPGHRRFDSVKDKLHGKYLGSLSPLQLGDTVRVDRG